jgi:enterobacteria phage integrase
MAPRQRKESNRALRVDGLRVRDGYYSWRNPETGVEYGLGRDRRKAISEAMQANAHLSSKRVSLVERITGSANTWAEWCDVFEGLLAERESSLNTRRARKSQMNRLRVAFAADAPAGRIDTRDCAKVIDGLKLSGKHRTAQAFRSFLVDCFDRMVAKGWRKDNPARVLDEVRVKVQRARLTLEVFDRLYASTTIGWLRNAMALMLVSGQAREDCATAMFTDIHDGAWWNERGKTGARIILPLELRLDAFPLSLDDVVRQCRTTGIVSRHLIHQTERVQGATLGKKLHVDMITRVFKVEMGKLGLDWGGKQAPTVHEIRSLSARLYKAEGRVNPQELLGHKDPRTTAVYTDGRGEWVRVVVRK